MRDGREKGRGEGDGGERCRQRTSKSIEESILHYIHRIRDERVLREIGQQSSNHRVVHICFLNINTFKD